MSGRGKRSKAKANTKTNPRIIWLKHSYKALNKILKTKLDGKYQNFSNEKYRSEAINTKLLFSSTKDSVAWVTKNEKTQKN